MCHECLAGVHQFPFEDAGHQPTWAQTMFVQRPFDVIPVVCLIPFETSSVNDEAAMPVERVFRRDIFHNTKVGILRDFVGSSIMLLCKLKYFHEVGQPNGRDILLERAYNHFHWFCKTTGRTASLRSFSTAFLNAQTWDTFAWVSSKGSDTSHLVAWVQVLSAGLLNDPKNPQHVSLLRYINKTAASARVFLRIIYSHGLWLNRRCAAAVYENLHSFLQGYNACAFLSLNQFQFTAFAMKSKYHMVAHAKYDIFKALQDQNAERVLNMLVWACDMNEDMIGKVCRLSRKVSSRLTSQRTLELILIKSKALHRRFRHHTSKDLA